ncbi:hypothetical protein PENTCL1PPCAC_1315, partial [Pristionchus entomophagus]
FILELGYMTSAISYYTIEDAVNGRYENAIGDIKAKFEGLPSTVRDELAKAYPSSISSERSRPLSQSPSVSTFLS